MTSIRSRLLVLLLATLAAAATLMGAVTYRNALAQTEALFDYQLKQMALSLRDQGEVAPDAAQALSDRELDFVVQVWSADGRAIYATRRHEQLPARALLGFADIAVDGQVWRTFGAINGSRVIQVAQPRRVRRALAADAALRTVQPLAAIAPLAAIGIWWLAALTLRPLRSVAAAVAAREPASLQPLPTAALPAELAPLAAALNDLLARLAQAADAQRDFVADAAHELRSPLTALKLQLGLLERAGADVAAQAAARQALHAGIERAGWLVEQLLALARSEAGAPDYVLERVDLAALAREVLAAALPQALERGAELALDAPAAAVVQGHASALTALLRNLVDNALRHGPHGVRVEVGVTDAPPTVVVDDSGPGIPAADRERVFDRFVRRSDDAVGSGLGLAIVRQVAERHGATVALGASPLGGVRATVAFPG